MRRLGIKFFLTLLQKEDRTKLIIKKKVLRSNCDELYKDGSNLRN